MSNAQQWTRAKDLFTAALDVPEAERARFIRERCNGDEALRSRIESLVAAHGSAGAFLGSPTQGERSSTMSVDAYEISHRLQRVLAGRFSLDRELGHGGMGIVYLARDVALDRLVAIKLLPPALAATSDYRERFLREARTAASLSHPNLVPIHLVEGHDDLVFFVMAYVDGESLGERVRRAGPQAAPDVAKLVQEVSWALAYAHSRGVIHRDIKPDNILIDAGSGRALLTDFGIARVVSTETVSRQGEVVGTFRYMSPEQASGDTRLDGRSDLYSLGVTAFYALTGRTPFEADSPGALLAQHITEPAPPMLSVRADVPPQLAEVIDRCLTKDPNARFATGEQLAEAIGGAGVARADIAPTLREFLGAVKTATAQLLGIGFIWWTIAMILQRVAPRNPIIGSPLAPLYWVMTCFTLLIVVRPLLAARAVVRAGFDEHDVADAYVASSLARDANIDYELSRARRLGERFSRIWCRVAFLLLGAVQGWGVVGNVILPLIRHRPVALPLIALTVLSPVTSAFFLSLAIAPKWMVSLFTRGTPTNASFLHTVFASAPMRAFLRVAGAGLDRRRRKSKPSSAPTEVFLGEAAMGLFASLPTEMRDRLGDVRAVVESLEQAATELRARRLELDRAISDVGAAGSRRRADLIDELTRAKGDVDARLERAVSALENLRLDLVRLRAGVARASELTPSIEEARAVGEAIAGEIAARHEVDQLK